MCAIIIPERKRKELKKMTVRDLMDELSKYDENLQVEVEYRDGGGYYEGTDDPYVDLKKRYNYGTEEIEYYVTL